MTSSGSHSRAFLDRERVLATGFLSPATRRLVERGQKPIKRHYFKDPVTGKKTFVFVVGNRTLLEHLAHEGIVK